LLFECLSNSVFVDPGFAGGGPVYFEVEFVKGTTRNRVKAPAGTRLSEVAKSAGAQIKYSCRKGECRTCEVDFNGSIVKACQSYLPTRGTSSSGEISKLTVTIPIK
jgi:hypothetical protein